MSWERLTVVAFDFWTRSFSLDHLRTEPVVCGVARSVEFRTQFSHKYAIRIAQLVRG